MYDDEYGMCVGDDTKPYVRDGGDVAGGAADSDRRGSVQDHESR